MDNMRRSREIYERARRKSSGVPVNRTYKPTALKTRKKKEFRAAVATIALIAALVIAPKACAKVDYALDVRDATVQERSRIVLLLEQNGLNSEAPKDGFWHNNYSIIKEYITEDDLFGFYKYLGAAETEKILHILGYDSWNNYFSRKGYFDSEGNPSAVVWRNFEEARIVKAQREEKQNGRIH